MWNLYEGDCMQLLHEIEDGWADLVLADPPYGMDFQSNMREKDERFPKIAGDKQPFIWFLREAYNKTKEGGALICFCNWSNQEAFRQAIEWAGYKVRSHIIWDRGYGGMADTKTTFAPQHDIVWFATKGRCELKDTRPTSIMRSMKVPPNDLMHPNEKPVALYAQFIRLLTPPGGRVLDPFAGSGASGEAALMEDRDWIGIELDPRYAKLIVKRLSGARQGKLDIVQPALVQDVLGWGTTE